MLQHHSRQVKVERAPNIRGPMRAIHIFQHVVDGDHVMAWQAARQPEQMWHMHEIAPQAAKDCTALHVSAKSICGGQGDRLEIIRQLANLGDFFSRAQQEVLVFVVPQRQCADDIASISANAEFVDATNVEGNPHKEIVPAGCRRGQICSASSALPQPFSGVRSFLQNYPRAWSEATLRMSSSTLIPGRHECQGLRQFYGAVYPLSTEARAD